MERVADARVMKKDYYLVFFDKANKQKASKSLEGA